MIMLDPQAPADPTSFIVAMCVCYGGLFLVLAWMFIVQMIDRAVSKVEREMRKEFQRDLANALERIRTLERNQFRKSA